MYIVNFRSTFPSYPCEHTYIAKDSMDVKSYLHDVLSDISQNTPDERQKKFAELMLSQIDILEISSTKQATETYGNMDIYISYDVVDFDFAKKKKEEKIKKLEERIKNNQKRLEDLKEKYNELMGKH